ncbi:putative uroporphyrin-III C-methyltransferase [Prochlorococcus marinus str. MIT 9515]|uniref:uroporphyrinogen-III C-methyltransferase n=1 Tax=Prochlorococcus marinus (strain MIT 9515) TaxID=167542 RepID=A2BZ81_PROM5|nr:putative uroporphyrin-III C-methyltransferase [Prochlorococcus marinus str. MIT 9515]
MPGIVYLVGAGPGDPELLTLKALRLIKSCDVLVHDALISAEIIKETNKKAEIFNVGKRAGKCSVPQSDTNSLILKLAKEGKTVVRLKGGDPFVFSRGGEEVSFLEKNGISIEIVPGITSGIAAPTYYGIPLTHREAGSSITFVTGHEHINKDKKNVNWRALSQSSDGLVIYMGIRNIEFIVSELILGGLDKNTKCAVIQEATLNNQKCLISELKNLVENIRLKGFTSPSIVVIGRIVDFKVNNYITNLPNAFLTD